MLTIWIIISNEEIEISRSVLTLVDILAVAGGFANIVLLCTRWILKIYSTNRYYTTLIQKFFKTNRKHYNDGTFRDFLSSYFDNAKKIDVDLAKSTATKYFFCCLFNKHKKE